MRYTLGNSVREIFGYIKKEDFLDVTSKMTLLFVLTYFTSSGLRFPIIAFVGVMYALSIFIFEKTNLFKRTSLWASVSILVILDILEEWTRPANHHYILLYLSLAYFLVSFRLPGYRASFRWNIKFIVGLLLVFAGIQKLISHQYIDGSFLNFLFITGDLASHTIFALIQESEFITSNLVNLEKFNASNPNSGSELFLTQYAGFNSAYFKLFSWLTVVAEIGAGLLILFFSHKIFTHILTIAVILGIFMMRLECGFLSLLCIGGYSMTSGKMIAIKTVYVILYIIFITLIIIQVGYS